MKERKEVPPLSDATDAPIFTRERGLAIIRKLRLMDDNFMKVCFENNIPAVSYVLHIILADKALRILSVKTEYVVSSLHGRGVRFDIFATDSEGRLYDIEIQRSDRGAGQRRARLNSSLLDANALQKGMSAEQLPETYVIFITEQDVLGSGLPIYHVDRSIAETGQSFGDAAHIIYVNGAYDGDDPLGRLMRDFRASDPAAMADSPLRDTVRHFKETEKGVSSMCKELEKIVEEAETKGMEKGMEKGMATGIEKGMATGRLAQLHDLVKKGLLTLSTAAREAGMTEDAFRKAAML